MDLSEAAAFGTDATNARTSSRCHRSASKASRASASLPRRDAPERSTNDAAARTAATWPHRAASAAAAIAVSRVARDAFSFFVLGA